jgi:hypothetical protein
MSQINVNTITGKDGGSAVNFPHGITVTGVVTATTLNQNVSGIVTATSFSGPLTGDVTGNVTGNITSSGANTLGSLTVSNDATITGNLTVQGTQTVIDTATLSVEDKNIGIGSVTTPSNTTADGGGITLFGGADGDKTFTWVNAGDYWNLTGGFLSAPGAFLNGFMKEGIQVVAGKLSDNQNIDVGSKGVHLFTTQETTTATPNFRFSGSSTLASNMSIGQSCTVTIITTAASAAYAAAATIDGGAVTERWNGGSAPSSGNSTGYDVYTYTIIKTGNSGTVNNDFIVLVNTGNYAG